MSHLLWIVVAKGGAYLFELVADSAVASTRVCHMRNDSREHLSPLAHCITLMASIMDRRG